MILAANERELTRIFPAIGKDHTAKFGLLAEVEEETDFERCGAEIIQELGLVRRVESLRGLEFDDQSVGDYEVCFEISNQATTEYDLEGDFTSCRYPCILQRNAHTPFGN